MGGTAASTVDVVVYSGLLSGALAFIGSLAATAILFLTNRKQARLLQQLQDEKLAFDAKGAKDRQEFEQRLVNLKNEYDDKVRASNQDAARQLEEHKDVLSRRKLSFETELRRRDDFLGRQLANLFSTAERSQAVTRQSLGAFQAMLRRAPTASNDEFLKDFSSAVTAFNAFSEMAGGLENLVRRKDNAYLSRCRDTLLEVLLGMRLEQANRKLPDFEGRVTTYNGRVKAMDTALNAKYRRLLQPRIRREAFAGAPQVASATSAPL
jgi:hypothetical protein